MLKVIGNVCSATFIIHGVDTGYCSHGHWVECLEHADNYHAEILDGVAALLVLHATNATCSTFSFSAALCLVCDNEGVFHGNKQTSTMPDKLLQTDALCLIKQ